MKQKITENSYRFDPARQITAIKVMNRRYYQLSNSLYYVRSVSKFVHFQDLFAILKPLTVILFLGYCVVKVEYLV